MGDEDPRFRRSDRALEISGEASASSKPGEGALDDPATRENFEALCSVGPLDDLQHEAADLPTFWSAPFSLGPA